MSQRIETDTAAIGEAAERLLTAAATGGALRTHP